MFQKLKEFRENRKQKRIERSANLVRNGKAIKEDRWAAIEFLASLKDPALAVPALMGRFDYSLEHGINDTREKEKTLKSIAKFGESALPYVTEHLKSTTRIAWPIKVIKELGSEDQVVEILKQALNYGDIDFDQSQVDKNYDILCYLVDYPVPDFVDKLAHFLKDSDERVRFACTELLVEQDNPAVPQYLEKFVGDESAENTRIRQVVLEAFADKGWKLSKPDAVPEGRIAKGFFVEPGGRIIRQG